MEVWIRLGYVIMGAVAILIWFLIRPDHGIKMCKWFLNNEKKALQEQTKQNAEFRKLVK